MRDKNLLPKAFPSPLFQLNDILRASISYLPIINFEHTIVLIFSFHLEKHEFYFDPPKLETHRTNIYTTKLPLKMLILLKFPTRYE